MYICEIKAMHLPEIFGVSTFPVFQPYWYFDGRNKSDILTLVLNVRKFCKTFRKSYQNYGNQKMSKISWNFRNMSKMSKIYRIFWKSMVSNVLYDLAKYIHSKNAFKTVLARSGAEINHFLCFGHMTDIHNTYINTCQKHCFWHVCMAIFSKIFGKIFGKKLDYQNKYCKTVLVPMPIPKMYRNVPVRMYRLSWYIFPKLYWSSKLLPERMALCEMTHYN